MSRLKVAVIGCGHLGSIHARLLAARSDVELVAVVDPSASARDRVAQASGCAALAEPSAVIGQASAVIVAAPTGLHASVSLPLLEAGVDLLIEKPIAATVEEARSIVVAARRFGRVVAVGHVERFNPAWCLAVEQAGAIRAMESARLSPFSFRSMDVGVVFDLMIHDIDLVLSLEPGRIERIEAHGIAATGGHEDMVRARLTFSSGFIADLSASRIHPTPHRSVSLWSSERLVSVDFTAKTVEVIAPSEAVCSGKFIASEVPTEQHAALKGSFFDEILPRKTLAVPEANALVREHDDFLDAIRLGRPPQVPATAGAAALEIAARIIDSLACVRFGSANPMPAVLSGTGTRPIFPLRKTG